MNTSFNIPATTLKLLQTRLTRISIPAVEKEKNVCGYAGIKLNAILSAILAGLQSIKAKKYLMALSIAVIYTITLKK